MADGVTWSAVGVNVPSGAGGTGTAEKGVLADEGAEEGAVQPAYPIAARRITARVVPFLILFSSPFLSVMTAEGTTSVATHGGDRELAHQRVWSIYFQEVFRKQGLLQRQGDLEIAHPHLPACAFCVTIRTGIDSHAARTR